MDQRSSIKTFFHRRTRNASRTEKIDHPASSGAARPQTAVALIADEQQPRLINRPKSAHGRTRFRRHTDAGARPPVPPTITPPSRERYVELDRHATSLSSRSRKRYSEDVADRNLGILRPDRQLPTTGRSVDILDHNLPGYPRVVAEKSRYSEDVANRNMSVSTLSVQSTTSSSDFASFRRWEDHLAATEEREQPAATKPPPPPELVQKRKSLLDKIAAQPGTTIMFVPPTEVDAFSDGNPESPIYPVSSLDEAARHATRISPSPDSQISQDFKVNPDRFSMDSAVSSLHLSDPEEVEVGPLNVTKWRDQAPPIPRRATKHTKNWLSSSNVAAATGGDAVRPVTGNKSCQVERPIRKLVDTSTQKSLEGSSINLSDTIDTHLHTDYAPAMTKELVKPTMHEIRQEQITREIHNHDVFHRILPIKQTEVLPARHFYCNQAGEKIEIDAREVRNNPETTISVKHVIDNDNTAFVPRHFTASTLEGFPRDHENRIDADGVCRSHTTWIHPPVLQDGGRETGQTAPFHFGGNEAGMPETSRVSNEWHDM